MAEIVQELGSMYVPKTISQILEDVSTIYDCSTKVMILEFHIQALEEEMRRTGASNLPLYYSLHFLEDAIEMLKQEILRWKRSEKNPVLEELMPLKSGFKSCLGQKESNDISHKKEWMDSVQLWTVSVQHDNNFDTKNQNCEGYEASSSRGNFNHKAGAFMPFQGATRKNKDSVSSLATDSDLNIKINGPQQQKPKPKPKPKLQPLQKKERRCWSPEMHMQFVDALHQLGGVESATPKHIREVMNVEGLTNDEVKSHLQGLYPKDLSPAGKLSYTWATRDNQRAGALMPAVAYLRTPKRPNNSPSKRMGSNEFKQTLVQVLKHLRTRAMPIDGRLSQLITCLDTLDRRGFFLLGYEIFMFECVG